MTSTELRDTLARLGINQCIGGVAPEAAGSRALLLYGRGAELCPVAGSFPWSLEIIQQFQCCSGVAD